MNKHLLALIPALLFFLSSCSQDKPQSENNLPEEVVDYELKSGELLSTTDFGDIPYGKEKIITLRIKNSGDETLLGPMVAENVNFQLLYQQGCENLVPNKICTAKISFSAKEKEAGLYTGSFALDSVIIPVQANVLPAPGVANPSSVVQFSISANPVSLVSFGILIPSQTVIKTIQITNQGNVNLNQEAQISGLGYSIGYDSCSNKALAPGKPCQLKVVFDPRGLSGLASGQISYGTNSLNLSAEVLTPGQASEQRSDVVFLYNNQQFSASSPMNLGNVIQGENYLYNIFLKNIGTAPAIIDSKSFSIPQMSIVYSNCSTILTNRTCLIKAALSPQVLGTNSAALNVAQGALEKSGILSYKTYPKVETSCTLANANQGGIDIDNVSALSGNLPDCVVTSCNGTYQVAEDQKSCSLPTTALIGMNKTEATQLGGYFPVQLNYKNLIVANNNDYSNVTFSIEQQSLGGGEYSCSTSVPTNCIYIPNALGEFFIVIKGQRSSGEVATARVDISVFGSENVPEFTAPGKVYISLRQGESLDFNLVTATSGADTIRYEVDQHPAVGQLSHCLNLQFADNANNDLSCRYLASGNLFSTSFTYKAINTVNNKFSIKEVQINILDSDNILDVYPSKWASLALNDAGFVFGRGSNESKVFGIDQDYQLSNFVFESTNAIKVPLNQKVSKLWVKGNSAIAKLENGEYWAWGQNRRSRLGIQSYTPAGDIIYKPQRVNLLNNRDFIQITLNENSACGLTSGGEVYCWGSNEFSELGDNSTTANYGDASTLRKINFGLKSQASQSAVGWDTNTNEYTLGSNGSATRNLAISNWALFLKSSQKKTIGDFEVTYTATNTDLAHGWFAGVSKNITSSESGAELAGFLVVNNVVKTYANSAERTVITLAEGLNTFKVKRVGADVKFILNNVEVDQVVYGSQDIYPALRLNGKVLSSNVLGINPRTASMLAESSVRSNTHCAVIENDAYCWGLNSNGQLGAGRTSVQLPSSPNPTKVLLTESVKKVAVGASFNCAITNSDRIKCWGSNSVGQLGIGDTTDRGITEADMQVLPYVNLGTDGSAQPLKSREVYIGAGGDSICSILNDYRVKCWGVNSLGQLGYGDIQNRGTQASHMGNNLPYLKNISNVDLVAAYLRTSGEEDFCLRSNVDTKVYCWGNNQFSSISPIYPNTPSVPREYFVNPGDTAPFLVAGSQVSKTFITNQGQTKTIGTVSPTNFKDLYSPDDAVLYFFDETSNMNIFTGVIYDSFDSNIVAGRLSLSCLGGINRTQLNSCQFTPEPGYTGSYVLKYKACSQNLKCSDQLITLVSRVTDPNKPYFENNTLTQTISLKRFESKSFSIPLASDPQGRPWGYFISSNSARKNMYTYVQIFNENEEVVGVMDQSCFTQHNQSEVPSIYSHHLRANTCTFYPKENFTGSATLKYIVKNSAGFTSEERSVTFTVQSNYQKALHAIGYKSAFEGYSKINRYPEQHGFTSNYGGLYLALGGSDNSVYAGPYSDKDMYPVPVYHNMISDTNPTKAYGSNTFEKDILSNIEAVVGKNNDMCAIVGPTRKLLCWSDNFENMNSGQLNATFPPYYITNPERVVPRYIANTDLSGLMQEVEQASIGDRFGCAIQGSNKSVLCWGKEVKGCGSSFTPGVPCPVIRNSDDTALINAKSISVGRASACAVVTENTEDKLYCWGYKLDAGGAGTVSRPANDYTNTSHNYMKAVSVSVTNPVKVVVGEMTACSSSTDNKLYCFGFNGGYGLLGRNITEGSLFYDPAPVKYNGADLSVNPQIFDIATGTYYSDTLCSLGQNSNLYCWGYSPHFKLWNVNTGSYPQAQEMVLSEISPIKKLSLVDSKMCIQTLDNKLKCWGSNTYGELGSQSMTWLSYAESDYVKNEPNSVDAVVTDFALHSNLTYLVSPQLIENHEYYQQGKLTSLVAEGESFNATLVPNLDEEDEIVIMKKPSYGYINEGTTLSDLVYTSTSNIAINGEPVFDYITYYKVSDPSKLYKYVFEVTPTNSVPVSRDVEDYSYVQTDKYLYPTLLATDPESQPLAMEFISTPVNGTLTCYDYAGFPTQFKQYCYYKANEGTAGMEENLSFRISDNNGVSAVKNLKIKIYDNNGLTAVNDYVEINTLSYYNTTFTGPRAYSPQGEATGIVISSGLVNDGGLYKVKDAQDITVGTIDPNCFLSGSITTMNCIFKPIRGAVGTASIQYRLTRGAQQTEPMEIKINIGANLNNLLYSVGYVQSGFAGGGSYQTNSYLYRLQGGTNPSIQSADPYPVPLISRGLITYPGSGGISYTSIDDRKVLSNIEKISQSSDHSETFVAISEGNAYMYGSMHYSTPISMHNFYYGGTGFWKMFFNDNTPVEEVSDVALGYTQGCAVYGGDKKLACWGRTRYEQISQNDILRSGCGPKDTYTRKGFACPIVKRDLQQLNNVEKVVSRNNSTCAIVTEEGKGQLYCWGFRFDSNGVDSRAEATKSHNTNYAEKVPGFENDDVQDIAMQDNKACVILGSGKLACIGGTNYWGAKNRPDLSGKYLGRTAFIADATVSGDIALKQIVDEKVIIEVPVNSADASSVSLANWSVENVDDTTPVVSLSSDRVAGGLVYKSISITLNSKQPYTVSFSKEGYSYSGSTQMVAVKPSSLIYNNSMYCVNSLSNDFYCWGYDQGRVLSETASQYFNSNEITKIPSMSQLEPFKKVVLTTSNMCLINIDDEVKCWGNISYGNNGMEAYSSTGTSFVRYQDAEVMQQKVDGLPVKALDVLSYYNSTLILSEDLMDINLDPQPQEVSVDENGQLAGLIPDVDTSKYEYFVITKPNYGILSGDITNLTYTGQNNYSGQDQFTYRVYDKLRNYSVVKTVIVKVRDINNPPKADDKFYSIEKNTINNYFYMSGTDVEGNALTYSILTQPTNGTLTGCTSSYCIYNPTADYVGVDSYTYRVFDGTSYSAPKTVSVEIRNDKKPYFDNSLYAFSIPKNISKYTLTVPLAKVPNYSSGPYYELIYSADVVKEIDNSVSFKQNGETVAVVNNCFMASPIGSYSATRDCSFVFKKAIVGSLNFEIKAINPAYTQIEHHSENIQIQLNVGTGSKSLYALGQVSGSQYNNGIGHFEIQSLEYRIRGGAIGNQQIAHLSDKEVYPVPMIYNNVNYYNVDFFSADDSGMCWQNSDASKEVLCLNTSNGNNQFGLYSFNYYNPTFGPVQNILYADNSFVSNLKEIETGTYQSCGIDANDKAICWGNTLPTSIAPTTLDYTGCGFVSSVLPRGKACNLVDDSNNQLTDVIDISVGSINNGCLVKNENSIGQVYCWGVAFDGSGVVSQTAKPVPSLNNKSAVKVSVGENYLCVAYNDNSVKCMGSNSYGRIGIDATDGSYKPASELAFFEADGTTPVAIKPHTLQTKNYMACVMDLNDKLQCWGYSYTGTLTPPAQYPNASTYQYKPKIILENLNIASYSMSNFGICTTNPLGEVRCAGDNGYGQLGNPRSLLEFQTSSSFNNTNYISSSEIRPIKEYLNQSNVKADSIAMSNYNTYLLVNGANTFDVPVLDIQEVAQEVNENETFSFSLGDPNNLYYIFRRPDYATITGTSAQNLFFTVRNDQQNSYIDYITYLVKDILGNSTVKKYIFKVTKQNDRPVYVNKNLITHSNANLSFSHQVVDADSNSWTYTVTQPAVFGTLNCTGASCSYLAPTLAPTDSDLVEVVHFRATDNSGLDSAVDGVVTITIKPISNPTFATNFVAFSIFEKSPYLSLQLPVVKDPKNNLGQISYQQNNNSVRVVVDPTLGQVAMVYDKNNSNNPAGHITGCALAANATNVGDITSCVFYPKAGFIGTASFEYIATNGSEASSVVEVEIEIKSLSLLANQVFVRGYAEVSRSGDAHKTTSEEGNVDQYVMPIQNEYYSGSELNILIQAVGNVENMYYNPRRQNWCMRRESSLIPGKFMVECNNPAGEAYIGKRTGPSYPYYVPNYTLLNARFIPINDETNSAPMYDINKFSYGYSQTCAAVGVNNELVCWGETSDYGSNQSTPRTSGCGFGHSITSNNIPCGIVSQQEEAIDNVLDIGLGSYDRCIIVDNNGSGQLLCWGFENFGKDGQPVVASATWANERNFAMTIPGTEGFNFREVEGGENFACAETNTGSIVCWGQNKSGQLGINTIDQVSPYYSLSFPPAEINLQDNSVNVPVKPNTLVTSSSSACAIGTDHQIYCWGANLYSNMYEDGSGYKQVPTKLTGFTQAYDFKKIKLGDSGMCGILLSDEVLCWGYNPYKAFGNISVGGYVTRAQAQKIIDPATSSPMQVKDLIMPYYNIMFIKK